MSLPLISNPWTPYGLASDPYFQEPLTPSDAGEDGGLFVGRTEEVRDLGRNIGGSNVSRAIVQGPPGVGKTTILNRLKASLAAGGHLTHDEPIRVVPGMTVERFCVELLHCLINVHRTTEALAGGARGDADFWNSLARRVQGEDSIGWQANLGPVGGGRTRVRVAPELGERSLHQEVAAAIDRLTEGGTRKLLLHVDNVENLSAPEQAQATALFLGLRDFFMIRGGHWVFVGADDLVGKVFDPHPQLRGIVPVIQRLRPLDEDVVAELLQKRYAHLALPGVKLVAPVEQEAVKNLYRRHEGDLRNFLRVLSQAGQRRILSDTPAPMKIRELLALMSEPYAEELRRSGRIGEERMEHLKALAAGRAAEAEVRQSDLQRALGVAKSSAKDIWDDLVAAGALVPVRTEGLSRWHRFSAEITVALGLQ